MMRFLIAALFILFFLQGYLPAQEIIRNRAEILTDSIINTRGEAYIAVPTNRLKAYRPLADKLIFDKYTGSYTYYYLNKQSFILLKKSGIEYYYVVPPSLAEIINMAKTVKEVLNGMGYPTYQQYLEIMDSFRLKFPSICRIDTIGYSKNGKLILSARLHKENFISGDKPVLMFSSTIHGDEPLGYVLMLRLLDEMLKGYGLIDDFTNLINETVILINPLANPDGTYYSADSTIYGAIRQNSNYVDLNRYFPERIYGDDPQNYNWQPENQAMMMYLWKYKPSLSANLHSGSEVVNYPWDATPDKHPDDNWFRYISKEFADTAKKVDPEYMSEFPPDGITNGYAWYPVYGGRMDYVTYFLSGREVTIELSDIKIPLSTSLPFHWFVNRQPFINYLKQGLYGVWGVIKDSENGNPVESKIEIPGYDQLNSYVISNKSTGKFFRYLYQGNYDFQVTTKGYSLKSVEGINVMNHVRTNLSVLVQSNVSLLKNREIIIAPNPFKEKFIIYFKEELESDCELQIYDYYGKIVFMSVFISQAGPNHFEIDLSDKPDGLYTIKLISGRKILREKIIKAG